MNAADIAVIPDAELLAATRGLASKSCSVEAELLMHLGEVDARKLYAGLGYSSTFAFCLRELGFSEGAASNRILVARAARRLPAMLEAARTGRVHLTGLRLLAPHLTVDNCDAVLAAAAGRTKEEILELVAKLAPRPAVETLVRKLPAPSVRGEQRTLPVPEPTLPVQQPTLVVQAPGPAVQEPILPLQQRSLPVVTMAQPQASTAFATRPREPAIMPLAEDLYKIQLSAPRAFKDKLKQAQDLMAPGTDVLTVLSAALDLLLEKKLKSRIGAGKTEPEATDSDSRYIPAAIRRAVWERDGARCSFVGSTGVRCNETRALEFDHVDGFARTHKHDPAQLRLLCRAHNQHAAEQLYGREFMEQRRRN